MRTLQANLPLPRREHIAGGFIPAHPHGQGRRGRAEARELEGVEERVEVQPEIIGAPQAGHLRARPPAPRSSPGVSQRRD